MWQDGRAEVVAKGFSERKAPKRRQGIAELKDKGVEEEGSFT